MAPRPLGHLRRVLVNSEHAGFCWFLDVCCFIEEHIYSIIYYILTFHWHAHKLCRWIQWFMYHTHHQNIIFGTWGDRLLMSDQEAKRLRCRKNPEKMSIPKRFCFKEKCWWSENMCVCFDIQFYQFHLWYSFIALVIHSHHYIILKWNKQPVGMPPGKKKTLVNCQLLWSPDTSVARGVLQARCGDKNFKAGWLESISPKPKKRNAHHDLQ